MKKLITLFAIFLGLGIANAQSITYYVYGSVTTRDGKSMIFSPVLSVNAPDDSNSIRSIIATDFKDAFGKFVKGEMGYDIRVDIRVTGPNEKRQYIENDRQDWMKRARNANQSIIHIYDRFYYKFDTSKY